MREGLEKYFPSDSDVTIIAEPGRYYVETAGTLVTNIIGIKAGRQRDESTNMPRFARKSVTSMQGRPLLKKQPSIVQTRGGRKESVSRFCT